MIRAKRCPIISLDSSNNNPKIIVFKHFDRLATSLYIGGRPSILIHAATQNDETLVILSAFCKYDIES